MDFDNLSLDRLRRLSGAKWRRYPAAVLPAWVADMDFEPAPVIREALAARVAIGDCGYPTHFRRSGLPELFCERLAARFDWSVTTDQVDLYSDVVQAIYFGLLALSEEHAGVVIQTPIYPPFLESVAVTGRSPVLCPLVAGDSRYEIDFDALRAGIDASTRILLLCSPHNPTGRSFSRDELETLAEVALANDLYIISDEIHADLILDDRAHIPIASLGAEVAERTVTLMSASKAFNIAGLCMAFAVYGSGAVAEKFAALPHHLRGGVNTLSMAAVTAAWRDGQPWLDATLDTLRGNRDFVADFIRTRWPKIGHFPPEATYLSWLDCRALELPEAPYRFFLDNARVALSEGLRFGEPGRGHVRLNFATSRPILTEILDRMDTALRG